MHGLYYLLMHPVLAVHPGEVALRVPVPLRGRPRPPVSSRPSAPGWPARESACGRACCTRDPDDRPLRPGGTFVRAGRGRGRGIDAAAGAGGRGSRVLVPYGGVVAVTCLLHEFAVLVLLAHAVTLALARVPPVWADWLSRPVPYCWCCCRWRWSRSAQSGQVAWLGPRAGHRGTAGAGLRRPDRRGPRALPVADVRGLRALDEAPRRAVPPRGRPPAARPTARAPHDRLSVAALRRPLCAVRARRRRCSPPRGRSVSWPGPATAARARSPRPACWPSASPSRTSCPSPGGPLLAAPPRQPRRRLRRRRPCMRPGDPVLFLPAIGRRSALAYPKGFQAPGRRARRAHPYPAPHGREPPQPSYAATRRPGPRLGRRRSVRSAPSWHPSKPTERVKLAVMSEQFGRERTQRERRDPAPLTRRAP